MGYKIFVTYKYADTLVKSLNKRRITLNGGKFVYEPRLSRVRDYVDELQQKIGKDHINLGEKDGESLEEFKDTTIQTSLKSKIFHSSVTIVMISKGMKDAHLSEDDQWIPWEVSYSLREVTRDDRTSQMNAVFGVVLPDETGTYNWYYTSDPVCNCTTHHTGQLFKILSKNMFNIKEKKFRECKGFKIHLNDESSFIKTVEWDTFISNNNYNNYIDQAIAIRSNKDLYDIEINLD